MDDKEPFLKRWSRRKLETVAEQRAAAQTPATLPTAAAPPAPAAAAAVQAEEELQKSGTPEYREFFDPKVDEALRRVALKKLFNDPHFNVMDGLDTYIDDYSKPDPIPVAMLRQLNQAKDLLLFDEEKKSDEQADARALDTTDVVDLPDPAAPALAPDPEVSAPAEPAALSVPRAVAVTGTPAAAPLDHAGE